MAQSFCLRMLSLLLGCLRLLRCHGILRTWCLLRWRRCLRPAVVGTLGVVPGHGIVFLAIVLEFLLAVDVGRAVCERGDTAHAVRHGAEVAHGREERVVRVVLTLTVTSHVLGHLLRGVSAPWARTCHVAGCTSFAEELAGEEAVSRTRAHALVEVARDRPGLCEVRRTTRGVRLPRGGRGKRYHLPRRQRQVSQVYGGPRRLGSFLVDTQRRA